MKLKRFVAPSTREALKLVKDSLGDEAVLFSTKRNKDQVEVIAGIHSVNNNKATEVSDEVKPEQQIIQKVTAPDFGAYDIETTQETALKELASEFNNLKYLVQEQLSNLVWNDTKKTSPVKAKILQQLTQAGFSSTTIFAIAQHIQTEEDYNSTLSRVKDYLIRKIQLVQQRLESPILIMGAAGTGKTTAVCKMAAQFVKNYGPNQVVILSLDNQKLAADHQIKTMGKILSVPVSVIQNEKELSEKIQYYKKKKYVIIDTPSTSSHISSNQTALLQISIPHSKVIVLDATMHYQNLLSTIKLFEGMTVHGVMLSKIDQSQNLGAILSVLFERDLAVLNQMDSPHIYNPPQHADLNYLIKKCFDLSKHAQIDDRIVARKISEVKINEYK